MSDTDPEYGARLDAALRVGTVQALREFLESQAARYGDERQVQAIRDQSDAELTMVRHRMILARPALTELHAESERWLASRGGDPPQPRSRRQGGGGHPGAPGRRTPRRAP